MKLSFKEELPLFSLLLLQFLVIIYKSNILSFSKFFGIHLFIRVHISLEMPVIREICICMFSLYIKMKF